MKQRLRGVAFIALAVVLFLGLAICCNACVASQMQSDWKIMASLSDPGPPDGSPAFIAVLPASRGTPDGIVFSIDEVPMVRYNPPIQLRERVTMKMTYLTTCRRKAEPSIPKRE